LTKCFNNMHILLTYLSNSASCSILEDAYAVKDILSRSDPSVSAGRIEFLSLTAVSSSSREELQGFC